MKKTLLPLLILLMTFSKSDAQENVEIFSRLQAISNSGTNFLNIDGIEITTQTIACDFSKKNVAKKFKRYSIKEADLNQSDTSINRQNFFVSKAEEIADGLIQNTSYYFVETPNGVMAITFSAVNKTDKELERQLAHLLTTNGIPQSVYEPMNIDSINFARRKLPLGRSCRWMGINNVQCPYYGQMNWSVHKTLEDATSSANNQYKVIKTKKQGKVVLEEEVNVVFEGNEIEAKKVVFDFKGVTSLLVGMGGGKTLTIYFVAAPVRQNFVSCVMSFWNNDAINPSGLPPLLEQVMELKN